MKDNKVKEINKELGSAKDFKEQLALINSYLEEAEMADSKDEFAYLIPGLRDLTNMFLECEQPDMEIDPDGDAIFTTKVFKLNRYVPGYIMDMYHVKYTKCCGVFAELPCWILPANKVKEAMDKKKTSVLNPLEHGLPSGKVANYATFKQLGNGHYLCLAKFENYEFLSGYLYSAKHIDYVIVK